MPKPAESAKLTEIQQVIRNLTQSKSPFAVSELSKTLEDHIVDLHHIRSS
jgi:hypothetical protein